MNFNTQLAPGNAFQNSLEYFFQGFVDLVFSVSFLFFASQIVARGYIYFDML